MEVPVSARSKPMDLVVMECGIVHRVWVRRGGSHRVGRKSKSRKHRLIGFEILSMEEITRFSIIRVKKKR